MAIVNRVSTACAISLLMLSLACGDDDADNVTNDDDVSGMTEGVPADCDPVGAVPEVGALLNAPVEADVEVIIKTPRHPGPPGPENLP